MSDENSEWSDVTIPEKVDFEVEDDSNEKEVIEQSTEVKTAEEIEQLKKGLDEAKKEPIKELDGIETSGAQKRIRNLVRQRKERDERIQALLKEKTDLEKNLRNMERTYVDTQKANSSVSQKQLEEQMALAKNDYIEAYNSGDPERTLAALDVLQRASNNINDLQRHQYALEDYEKQYEAQEEQQVQQQAPQQPDALAVDWAENNEWFGKDSVMTAAAYAIDAELKQTGYDPKEQDFYEEIDRRLRNEFPHKFDQEESVEASTTRQPSQVVAGTSRSPTSSNKKIKLSQEDVRLAQKWNIPLEVYAAEKLKVDKSDSEYTDITFKRGV
jgi:hypothetical protein